MGYRTADGWHLVAVRTPLADERDRVVVLASAAGAVLGVGVLLAAFAFHEGRAVAAVFAWLVAAGCAWLLVTGVEDMLRARVEVYEEGFRYVRGRSRGEIAWREVTRLERPFGRRLDPNAVVVVHVGAVQHEVPALLEAEDLRPLRARGIGLG